jgi:hypothetical protein
MGDTARGSEFIQQGEAGLAVCVRESCERATIKGEFPSLACITRGEGGKIFSDTVNNVDNRPRTSHARLPVLGAIDTVHGASGEGQKDRMDVFGPFLPHTDAEDYGAFMGGQCFFTGIF